MAFYETTAWVVTIWTFMGFLAIMAVANMMRMRAAPGTHRRYVWATVVHATIYPTVVGIFLQMVEQVAERDGVGIGTRMAVALAYVYLVVLFRRDNDDDWFNSGGPRRGWMRLVPGLRQA